ncbi:MAG: hypothetical protein NWE91_03965 [Candidatus Bathyarchaeota archaeon]|nr:hypothetical protein [Candidatus Bathyarchaeota archaeon]
MASRNWRKLSRVFGLLHLEISSKNGSFVVIRVENWLSAFRPSVRTGLLMAFAFGVAVRAIPELLSYPYPIGFDTIYYAWRIEEGVVWAHWSGVFSGWLLYALLVSGYSLLRVEPFLLLKIAMPLLFGLNVCGVYYLATKAFNWSARKSLFAAGLFSFQVAILGISWHFYRNMLGLGVLLFTLPWILKDKLDLKSLALFSVLSVLVVFSHEYGSVLLFVSVLGVAASHLLRARGRTALKVLAATLPAAGVFVVSVFPIISPRYSVVQSNVLRVFQSQGHYSGLLRFFTNYLSVVDTVQYYPTYLDLAASVASLFALLYVAILPLAIVGFFRHPAVDAWMILLCVGAFGCLVLPFFALDLWNRLMLMLVFPLTYYAANGFVRVLHSVKPVAVSFRHFGSLKVSKRVAKGLVLASVVCGFVFMTSPTLFGRGGVFGLPTTVNYLPSTMLSNAVPLSDVDGTVEAFRWVDVTMDGSSCFLAHDALFYWARFSLDEQHTIVFFKNDVFGAVSLAAERGYGRFWLVWWNTDIGWYGFKVPQGFEEVFSAGRISVYEYGG